MRLRASLRLRKIPFQARNIWAEPEYAAIVRSHAGGNETVPTVVIGDVAMVNPTLSEVQAALAAE